MVCKKCGRKFPRRIIINGELKDLGTRSWCIECSPFKQHRKGILTKSLIFDVPHICKTCGKEFNKKYSRWSTGDYCSKKCGMVQSAKANIGLKKEARCKICNKLIEVGNCADNNNVTCIDCKNPICKICGQRKCLRKDICTNHQFIKTLIKFFGFNQKKIRTNEIYEEFDKIKNLIEKEYYDNKMSTLDLEIKYKYLHQCISQTLFKNFKINSRTSSQSVNNAIIQGKSRGNGHNQYECGWHTTWNNKQVFYRSSYELDYCKELDEKKIDYEMEKLRILYWDTQLLRQRVAIPDFYLTQTNELVEIKSTWTYNEQNMKDKFKAYIEHGYKPKLILEHKEIIQ